MKRLSIISLLLLAVILPAAAETDTSLLIGTWVNPEYNPVRRSPKVVFKADGIGESYATTYAAEPSFVWTYTVEEAWQDAGGAYWFKKNVATLRSADSRSRVFYLLVRISPDRTTYEEDYIRENLREFATEINPRSYFYKILYRE
jgi:hypothetical protein